MTRKAMDLTGQKFGRLTVTSAATRIGKDYRWNCSCDCGGSATSTTGHLRTGHTKSCGCLVKENTAGSEAAKLALKGQVFGKLTALHEVEVDKPGQYWLCRCECGSERVVQAGNLSSLRTHHCGKCTNRLGRNPSHGMSYSTEYKIWDGIIQRCTNPNSGSYSDYGERGITVCDSWLDFKNFYSDMGDRPAGLTIDRIDNNRGYEPGNCQWATAEEQQGNTRGNRILTYKDISDTVTGWSKRTGINRMRLFNRLLIGWYIEETLTTPVKSRKVAKKEEE